MHVATGRTVKVSQTHDLICSAVIQQRAMRAWTGRWFCPASLWPFNFVRMLPMLPISEPFYPQLKFPTYTNDLVSVISSQVCSWRQDVQSLVIFILITRIFWVEHLEQARPKFGVILCSIIWLILQLCIENMLSGIKISAWAPSQKFCRIWQDESHAGQIRLSDW